MEQQEINNNWHTRFRAMKKGMNFTNKHIAEITGNNYDSIRNSTQPKLDLPRWAKLSVAIYEDLIKYKHETEKLDK